MASIITAQGCSYPRTIKTWYASFSGDRKARGIAIIDSNLKSIITIPYLENKTLYSSDKLKKVFLPKLVAAVKEANENIIVVNPEKVGLNVQAEKVEGTDQLDNFVLAQKGRSAGISTIITCTFTSITSDKKKKGIWGFRKYKDIVHMHMLLNIYDTETGSKILEETVTGSVFIDEADLAMLYNGNTANAAILDSAVDDIAKTAGIKISTVVSLQPWKGYIKSISGERVTLNAGSISGLKTGDILYAYDSGNIIEGKEKHKFYLPGGRVTCKMEIQSVTPETSQAVIISGERCSKDSCVIFPNEDQEE